ncbi:hypothetical protein AMTR_s00025p00227550, partial [Amborella trichopoda]
EAEASELRAMAFNQVAALVHECLTGVTNNEFFRGLVDWVEMQRPKPVLATIYCKNEAEEAAVLVSSGLRVILISVGGGRFLGHIISGGAGRNILCRVRWTMATGLCCLRPKWRWLR